MSGERKKCKENFMNFIDFLVFFGKFLPENVLFEDSFMACRRGK